MGGGGKGTEASRGERERAQSQWSSDRLVGVGRLVWPTGADTRRKHARRNVARFVASCTYWYTCTYTAASSRVRMHAHHRVSAPTRGEGGRDVGGAKSAEYGPKGNCAPLAGTVHGAVIATIFRVYRICICECRPKRAVRSDTHTFWRRRRHPPPKSGAGWCESCHARRTRRCQRPKDVGAPWLGNGTRRVFRGVNSNNRAGRVERRGWKVSRVLYRRKVAETNYLHDYLRNIQRDTFPLLMPASQ